MTSKFILIVRDNEIRKVVVRKPQAPCRELRAWIFRCASAAIDWHAKHYLFRFGGRWHVLDVDHPKPIRSFDVEHRAAAEMWLLHRTTRL